MKGQHRRRDFLKHSGAVGAGLALSGLNSALTAATQPAEGPLKIGFVGVGLKIGFVGVGGRGSNLLKILLELKGVEIRALCDIREDRVARAQRWVTEAGQREPAGYSRGETRHPRTCRRCSMRRSSTFALTSALVLLFVGSCHNSGAPEPTTDPTPETVTLLFQIELNQRVYENSTWGDPPQMAVWLQDETDDGIRTVAVTHRTGAGDWEGKVECCVALMLRRPALLDHFLRQGNGNAPSAYVGPAGRRYDHLRDAACEAERDCQGPARDAMEVLRRSECLRRLQYPLSSYVRGWLLRPVWKRPTFYHLPRLDRSYGGLGKPAGALGTYGSAHPRDHTEPRPTTHYDRQGTAANHFRVLHTKRWIPDA